jgi:hypothetical protein
MIILGERTDRAIKPTVMHQEQRIITLEQTACVVLYLSIHGRLQKSGI